MDQKEIKVIERKSSVFVTFQKEGIHKYPNAPEEVYFLRYDHRHMFHFTVEIEVFHDDRDIEFIILKRQLENLYSDGTIELDYKSCEMMSDELFEKVSEMYPNRDITITISEDGENGSVTKYTVKKES